MKRAASVPKPRSTRPPAKRSAGRTSQESSAVVEASSGVTGLSEAVVAQRAYEIFLARNGAPGDPVADWLQAEYELKSAL